MIVRFAALLLSALVAQAAGDEDCRVEFEMADRHPAGLPITVSIVVTNTTASDLSYSTIGHDHLATKGMQAAIVGDADDQGRYVFPSMLSGGVSEHLLESGGSLRVNGCLDPLPAKVYEIAFCPDPSGFPGEWVKGLGVIHRRIIVVDDQQLKARRLEEFVKDAQAGDPFAASLAVRFRIPEVLQVLYANLRSEDDRRASVAAEALRRFCHDPPPEMIPAIAAALPQRLRPPPTRAVDHNIDPWVLLLRLAESNPDSRYLRSLIEYTRPPYGYVREYALKNLARYDEPEAVEALRPFLGDEEPAYREIAACGFALRQNPAAVGPLVELTTLQFYNAHPWLYGALAQFPDDERCRQAIETARQSENDSVRRAALDPTVQIPP